MTSPHRNTDNHLGAWQTFSQLLSSPFVEVLRNVELFHLNFGVRVLHATQTALFLVVSRLVADAGLPVALHWKIYPPGVARSFVLAVPAIIAAESKA
jgi:hypothetical protein